MSKPWGGTGIGSWAADAELAEAEDRQAAATAAANPKTFPSLKESVSAKSKKKKMSLSEFYVSTQPGSGSSSTRLTPDEMIRLPTGPTARDPDDNGSGSRGWGGGPGQTRRSGFDGGGPRRGSGEYDSAPPPPSRADEVDNWGAAKRSAPIERERDRGPSSSSRYGDLGGGSRADEVDNWSCGKKPVSVGPVRSSNFGSGFGSDQSGSDWRRGEDLGPRDVPVGRPRLVLDPRSSSGSGNNDNGNVVKVNKLSPFGAARPREEVLTEKGLDWKKLDSEIEAKKASGCGGSRPTSSQGQGSRPTSSQSNRSESVAGGVEVKPRAKVNPFGDARPREVLLEEKGLDWRKIDLQLEQRRVDRPETEEEKALKEEIENLKKNLEKEPGNDTSQGSEVEVSNLRDLIGSKERDLEILIKELDDKTRFGPRAVERPGSGAGRPGSGAGRPDSGTGRHMGFQDRPQHGSFNRPQHGSFDRPQQGSFDRPQHGSFEDYRGTEAMDRPRSRGTGDIWTRPGEETRGGFQGNRDRGFLSNRDFNRPTSRERW